MVDARSAGSWTILPPTSIEVMGGARRGLRRIERMVLPVLPFPKELVRSLQKRRIFLASVAIVLLCILLYMDLRIRLAATLHFFQLLAAGEAADWSQGAR